MLSDEQTLIARLRAEAEVREDDLEALRAQLEGAQLELDDLRMIRDALTPPALPQRPGLALAAGFVPAAERVSGDFYLVAEGPRNATILAIGDVVGHGLTAARRAAFVRTAFIATAPFSDDPARLLGWVNAALIERAGTGLEFVTAACVTYLPDERCLRWAYAGHPPALRLDDGQELIAGRQGCPLGMRIDLDCVEGSATCADGDGLLLYTDGLTEARRGSTRFGLDGVRATLSRLRRPSPAEAVAALRGSVAEFTPTALDDDLCLLAARIG